MGTLCVRACERGRGRVFTSSSLCVPLHVASIVHGQQETIVWKSVCSTAGVTHALASYTAGLLRRWPRYAQQ